MGRENEIVAYWLIPAEPARSYFSSVIRDLAERFDAPVFEPHVTIHVTDARSESPAGVLAEALADLKPLHLSVSGIDYSDEFTKTVFVRFRQDETLTRLNEKLRSASTVRWGYRLNPHLSLIYKKIPHEARVQITSSLNLPFGEVCFDIVKAVISPAKMEARGDVEAWRTVAEQKLIG